MSIAEIRNAIRALDVRGKGLLKAELFAMDTEPDPVDLETALQRGLDDVEAGRVHEIDDVKKMIPGWASKSGLQRAHLET